MPGGRFLEGRGVRWVGKEAHTMPTMDELMKGHRDAITVKRAYGDPYEKDGVTVIPAAKVMTGGGGGEGDAPEGQGKGTGSGFGIAARPAGAYVIRGDEVKWLPAVDANRVIAGVFGLATLALLVALRRSK
jgi:uncharacterized spore protein YtfJ